MARRALSISEKPFVVTVFDAEFLAREHTEHVLKYLVLIYTSEATEAQLTKDDHGALMGEYIAYTQQLAAAKVSVSSEQLKPVATATTVRIRNGKTTHTDGPFAETKEQLGGFYLLDVPDLEKALEWAAKCPGAKYGSIEVRPLVDWSNQG